MKAASPEATAQSIKILAALAEASDLSQRLRHGDRGDDWDIQGYIHWRDARKNKYSEFQATAARIVEREVGRDWTPGSLLNAVWTELGRLDTVIVYAIACQSNIEAEMPALKKQAIAAYNASPKFYDRLLAHALPPMFQEIQAERRAEERYHVGSNATAEADWKPYLRIQDGRRRQSIQGCTSGLRAVDDALLGLSGLILLAGLPGCGKTSFAMQAFVAALKADPDLAVLFLQLDPGMSRDLMFDRLRCAAAGISYLELLDDRSEAVLEKLKAGDAQLEVILPRLRIANRPHSTHYDPVLVDDYYVSSLIRDLRSHTGVSRVLVIIDYLGQIDVSADIPTTSLEADDLRIKQVCAARESAEDIFLVICEVVKSTGSSVSAQDIKGSISKQYVADKILLLEQDGQIDGADAEIKVNLRIVKGRDGTHRVTIPLLFDHEKYAFRERRTRRTNPIATPVVAEIKGIDPMAGLEDDD